MVSDVPFVFLIKAQINLLTSIKWCTLGCFLDYENQSPIDMIKMEKRCKILDTGRKDANIQIGKRLREARLNMNLEKSEIADVLGVTVEHYRKLEAGVTGISVDKVLTLYHKYGIDPTYLITGESSNIKDFNLDYYVANSTKEQRNDFFWPCAGVFI